MRNVPPLCFFSESDGTPLDFSEKICYHILYRRSDLGVVSSNPEFGHKGLASLMLRCGSYFIREIAP